MLAGQGVVELGVEGVEPGGVSGVEVVWGGIAQGGDGVGEPVEGGGQVTIRAGMGRKGL